MVPLSHCSCQYAIAASPSVHVCRRPYVDAANQLAGAAVDVDARLGCAGPAVCVQLLLIAKDGCGSWSVLLHLARQGMAAYPPTAPLYGAPTTLYLSSSRSASKTAV
jgi:hypothetical protein